MEEIYKDLPGYEEFYMISNMGNCWSKRYKKIMKHDISKINKIHAVRLVLNNKKAFKTSVSRLVLLTFSSNPNEKLYTYAIHKDGNLDNLCVYNLVWGSPSQSAILKAKNNVSYPKKRQLALNKGIAKSLKMRRDFKAKTLPLAEQLRLIGYSNKEIAKKLHVCTQTVTAWLNYRPYKYYVRERIK